MNPVTLFLITVAGIFLLGALGEAVFKKTNVPDVVWLILVGMVVGPITGLVPRELLTGIAPYFAALTLVVVLFEGGSRLNLAELSKSAPRSGLLALLTFLVAALAVAVASMGAAAVGWLPDVWSWKHALLLGSILGGSSSIIIMPAMAQAKVEPKVANLVSLESAFTDAFCVVGASALIDLLVGAGGEGSSPGMALARSFGIGLLVGVVSGMLWLWLLRPLHKSEHAYPITLSALLLLYVLIERLGGSAALGILAFAIIVGNSKSIGGKLGLSAGSELRADVRGFHSQMTFIIKSFFFTFIGAMLGPPWSMIVLGVILGVLLLAARVPPTWLATVRSGLSVGQRKLVVVAMPRGMAAGVLATLPAAAGVEGTKELPTTVFAAVLTTIAVFAVGFPLFRRGEAPAAAAPSPTPEAATSTVSATGPLQLPANTTTTEVAPTTAPGEPVAK